MGRLTTAPTLRQLAQQQLIPPAAKRLSMAADGRRDQVVIVRLAFADCCEGFALLF